MSIIRQHNLKADPARQLVERAIVRLLQIAEHQNISAADFVQMLNSGMRISDFLNAMDVFTSAEHVVGSTTVN
ncbi:MAG: hypothetical protein ABSD75_13730 [Terriglobales bacterium]|jgi:hypothetical protein